MGPTPREKMRPRAVLSLVAIIASLLVPSDNAFGKTASCPCNPCTCSPCTCGEGSKGGKHNEKEAHRETEGHREKAEHHDEERHHDKEGHHEHGGVGVGINVDLSHVGERQAEPNPFAVGGGEPVAHTQEKTSKPHPPKSTPTTFDKIDLTSKKAKDLEQPGRTINVSDNDQSAPPPPPADRQTKEANNPPAPSPSQPTVSDDDGLPPPRLTERDCGTLRNNLLALLAKYKKALARVNDADYELDSLEQEAWEANNKLSEGYEGQSLTLIDQGREEWDRISKEWGPANRHYNAAFDTATKAYNDFVEARSAFQRMCPGVAPPEIPHLPEKKNHQDPEEAE